MSQRLRSELDGRGYARDFLIMNGNGGMISARFVTRDAAKTVMSGPAPGLGRERRCVGGRQARSGARARRTWRTTRWPARVPTPASRWSCCARSPTCFRKRSTWLSGAPTTSQTVGQLKGKRVSLGEIDSGTLATARVVLRGYGLNLKEFKPVYEKLARSADMLAMNEIDAFFMVGGQPIAAVVHAAERVPIALVAIAGPNARRIVAEQPFLKLTVIPAGAYPDVPLTETIGVGAQLLTTAAMTDDLAYAITRALWEPANRKILEAGNANGQRIRPQTALEGLAVPLHPGAERYYKENGMIPSERL